MISALRVLSFVTGMSLVAAPAYLLLLFAHGVGEPPAADRAFAFFFAPICVGLVLGAGLLLAGLPRLVTGEKGLVARFAAGALIILSALIVASLGGFSGSVTRIVTPAILLIELLVFWVFVWPAKGFQEPPGGEGAMYVRP
jgi:hypothetical protein